MRCTDLRELHWLTACHTKFLLLLRWWRWGFSNPLEVSTDLKMLQGNVFPSLATAPLIFNPLPPNDTHRIANHQTLHFKYLFNKYQY
jgi:hypothetical protein